MVSDIFIVVFVLIVVNIRGLLGVFGRYATTMARPEVLGVKCCKRERDIGQVFNKLN